MSKLPRITGKDAVRALVRAGFVHVRTRGSHFYLYHRGKDRLVTVPVHAGATLAPKTLKSILDQAKVAVADFTSLL